MLDDIHDYLLTNLAIRLGDAVSSGKDATDAEVLFTPTLEMLAQRQAELSEDDLATIGDWLHEAGEYFQPDDFVIHSFVLSKDPAKSGRQVRDLRPLAEAARAARARALVARDRPPR